MWVFAYLSERLGRGKEFVDISLYESLALRGLGREGRLVLRHFLFLPN